MASRVEESSVGGGDLSYLEEESYLIYIYIYIYIFCGGTWVTREIPELGLQANAGLGFSFTFAALLCSVKTEA